MARPSPRSVKAASAVTRNISDRARAMAPIGAHSAVAHDLRFFLARRAAAKAIGDVGEPVLVQRPGDGDSAAMAQIAAGGAGSPTARAKNSAAPPAAADYRPGNGKRAQSFAKVRHRRAGGRRRQVQTRINRRQTRRSSTKRFGMEAFITFFSWPGRWGLSRAGSRSALSVGDCAASRAKAGLTAFASDAKILRRQSAAIH